MFLRINLKIVFSYGLMLKLCPAVAGILDLYIDNKKNPQKIGLAAI